MFLQSILWFASWPLLVIISYQVIKQLVRRYEAKNN